MVQHTETIWQRLTALWTRMLGLDVPHAGWQSSLAWVHLGNRSALAMFAGVIMLSLVLSISGAVLATGTVTVEGNYKTIQHLDGGIVSKILVRNGDVVKRSDVLVRLEDTGARANLAIVEGRVREFLIQHARLSAERDRQPAFALPEGVRPFERDQQIRDILATQTALFDARRASYEGEQAMLRKRLEQVRSELTGQENEIKARRRQLEIATKELHAVEPLFNKGFASQQRLGGLQREQARLGGDVDRLVADIARSRATIAEAELKILQSDRERTQTVVDELRKVQGQIAETEEQRKTLADKLDRVVIRAPHAGRVHALTATTEGGVIGAGMQIMQIIPDDERLVIEAQVQPQDIDKVRQGSIAGIRFPAFNATTTPRLTGSVATVSAAELTTKEGRTYFTARIEIPPAELKRLRSVHRLVPGMPAEVHIETASRWMLSYLVKPLVDAMARSFND